VSNVITQAELRDAVGTGAVTVVDALPLRAYQRRHLPGAVNLPAEDIARAADVLPDRSSPIVVYSTDTDCDRGPGLAELLTGLGYRDIRLYAEGIEDWAAAGLPIESDAQR
jgi:rhodanese-related sulfurtransferase